MVALGALVGYTVISRLPEGSASIAEDDRILERQRKVADEGASQPGSLTTTFKALLVAAGVAVLLVMGPLGWVILVIGFAIYYPVTRRKDRRERQQKQEEKRLEDKVAQGPLYNPSAVDGGAVDIPNQIERLAELRDAGVITAEDFDEKKRDLLDRM